MDYSAIIYAALGGGIGGGIASFMVRLSKTEGAKKGVVGGLSVIFVIIGYTVSGLLYKNMKLPRILPLDTTEMVRGLPALEFIQTQNPDVFKQLIYPVDKAMRNKKVTQDTLNEFRKTYSNLLESKKKTASIETLKTEHEVSIKLFQILKDKAPVICTKKLHGRPFKDISGLVTQEYITQEQKVMASFFTAKNRDVKLVADKEAGKVLLTEMTQKIITALGITNLDPPPESEIANKKVCDFHIMLNSEIKELDNKDFIDVYGFMNSLNP